MYTFKLLVLHVVLDYKFKVHVKYWNCLTHFSSTI